MKKRWKDEEQWIKFICNDIHDFANEILEYLFENTRKAHVKSDKSLMLSFVKKRNQLESMKGKELIDYFDNLQIL